ncbi:surface protease GP63 [Trypanosoma theileri]|uniref:Leishmanolysin-like peptidase n=1 Tax=Trypanosoma theileri TaxID=67003 RepID=A0A1X0NLM0_9TRYP|nr:surface protease GP63 [Trypanosoma theileri]ORC85353.1 surface protease GP63 [Trypanosoma theileri]
MRRLFLFAPLLLLYCTLVTLAVTEHHRCMFDTVALRVGTTPNGEMFQKMLGKRKNQTTRFAEDQTTPSGREEPVGEEWKPIRIELVTDYLKKGQNCSGSVGRKIDTLLKKEFPCTEDDVLTPEKEEILVKKILPEAIELHKERLFVKPLKGPIVVPQFSKNDGLCYQFMSQDDEREKSFTTDMVLFAAAQPTTDGAFAWAATCATLSSNGRPVIGIINYGPRYIVATPQRVRVAAHEIAHALGFNLPEMEMKDMVGKVNSTSDKAAFFVVASDNTRREAMKQYNCDTLKGMELQNMAFVQVPALPVQAAAILAQVASVQEDNEVGESHSNVMDDRLTGEESVGSDVQERREEEGSSAAKFTHNVHHSSDVLSKRRSLYLQATVAESPNKCTTNEEGDTATDEECIVKTTTVLPNNEYNEGVMTRSHWSRRIAKDELMVGLVGAGYYTAITLGAFADLGYYKVNWTMAEQMSWGNNSNCEFLNNKCVNSGETKFSNMFCTTKSTVGTESLQCTSDRQSMGSCSSIEAKLVNKGIPKQFQYFSENNKVGSEESEQMDYCPFIKAKVGYSCINGVQSKMPESKIGINSRCVEGKDLKTDKKAAVGAVCVEVSCKFNKVIVRYNGNDKWYNCPEGKNLTVKESVLQGKIVCPKYADVCNTINKTLDESQGPATDPDIVEEVQTSEPESTEVTETAKPSESAAASNNAGNQGVSVPVVQNETSTTKESKPSETKEENITSFLNGQNNNAAAKKGTDGSFKASAFASVMFALLTLSVIMAP